MRFQRDTPRAAVIRLLVCAAVLIASSWSSLAQRRGAFAPAPLLKGIEDKPIAIDYSIGYTP